MQAGNIQPRESYFMCKSIFTSEEKSLINLELLLFWTLTKSLHKTFFGFF